MKLTRTQLDEKFFTAEQVANILQVHQFTILKFIREGKLKGIKLGRVYRIKESDVEEFLQQRMTIKSKPKPKVKSEKINTTEPLTPKSDAPQSTEPQKTAMTEPDGTYAIEKPKQDNDDHYYLIP